MAGLVDKAFEPLRNIREEEFFRQDLPPDVLEFIRQLSDVFEKATPEAREDIVERVHDPFRFIFGRYAFCSASEAVRKSDPGLIRSGLIALAIEDTFRDWRDTLPILAALYRSANKLNIGAASLFKDIAQIASPNCRRLFEGFLERDVSAREIESFRLRETGEGDTFAYQPLLPPNVKITGEGKTFGLEFVPSYSRRTSIKMRWGGLL